MDKKLQVIEFFFVESQLVLELTQSIICGRDEDLRGPKASKETGERTVLVQRGKMQTRRGG